MKRVKKPLYFLLLFILLSVTAFFVELNVKHTGFRSNDVSSFRVELKNAQQSLDEGLLEFEQEYNLLLANKRPKTAQLEYFEQLFNKKGLAYFIFEHRTLKFWTDNRIELPDNLNIFVDRSLVKLPSGWFYCRTHHAGPLQYIGLLLIKTDYPITNKYIKDEFNPVFSLSPSIEIYPSVISKFTAIYDNSEHFLFSLVFPKQTTFRSGEIWLPFIFYALAWLALLILLQSVILNIRKPGLKWLTILGSSLLLLLLARVMLHWSFPASFYQLPIFGPFDFAQSTFFPSLGDLVLSSSALLFFIYNICLQFNFNQTLSLNKRLQWMLRGAGLLIFIASFFVSVGLFQSLVVNSTINLDASQIIKMTGSSIICIILLFSYFTSIALLGDKLQDLFRIRNGYRYFSILFLFLFSISYFVVYKLFDVKTDWFLSIVFVVVTLIGSFLRLKKENRFNYQISIILILIFSSCAAHYIHKTYDFKQTEEQKVIALRLSSERDPVAENLFLDMNDDLREDTVVKKVLNEKEFAFNELTTYLRQKYFGGYFEKYDFQITVCQAQDSLRVHPENVNVPCFEFFSKLVESKGEKLPATDFYYINYSNARISYFGQLQYNTMQKGIACIYVELDARPSLQELGYPDLLLDKKLLRLKLPDDFSYARYYKGRLIAQSGRFPYNRTSNYYPTSKSDFYRANFHSYDHLFYQANGDNMLILSKPSSHLTDMVISFSYLFVFFFLAYNLIVFIFYLRRRSEDLFRMDFNNKIKYSLTGILLTSLLLVGGFTGYYTIHQFWLKHNTLISEKMQSVYREMAQRIGFEENSDFELRSWGENNLEVMLRSLSNIFYTDINLYDPRGMLIASSRPEVFDKHLLGEWMNGRAFGELLIKKRSEYIHFEKIGRLKYMSAYEPIVNANGEIIGYLNLPYFAKQSELWSDLYNQLFTLLNFYVLLILVSISFSVLISRRITQPLRWLQDRFSQVKLGGSTPKIEYHANDEIGALIVQYNRMVEELNRNIDLLARSERESAWREMAKQIAHEIKNPLTPMKLSVQHLKRAWDDKVENWDDYLKRVTQTLVEQIDTLSAIANEFSNFAKMPKPKNTQLSLQEIINDVLPLYSSSDTKINFQNHIAGDAYIFADKEQINRVFINLITNAIQAIPHGRKGSIRVSVFSQENQMLRIEIADNGTGVDQKLGNKLFEPNFTTKTSGMGLGLAIVKNIIENCGGSIRYISIPGQGTTFIFDLPKAD
jgi:two-component system, NtrC family, nitrogen regulation sensor histidine kinase NtrY